MEQDTGKMVFNFHFNAPVGQQIAHVDRIEAHFDKDMTMEVMEFNRQKPKEKDAIVEQLAPFFGMSFRGRNTYKTDYLPILVDDIRGFTIARDLARIANMLYNCNELINKPHTFAEWYRLFCSACGCELRTYSQNKVDNYDYLKEKFYYLSF